MRIIGVDQPHREPVPVLDAESKVCHDLRKRLAVRVRCIHSMVCRDDPRGLQQERLWVLRGIEGRSMPLSGGQTLLNPVRPPELLGGSTVIRAAPAEIEIQHIAQSIPQKPAASLRGVRIETAD